MGVQITLCGDVTVGRADHAAPVAGPARVVLAALVLERPVALGRDRLADILWPDGPPRTWGSALRTYASRARTALAAVLPDGAPDAVVSTGGAYALALPAGVELAVDVEEAERDAAAARAALAGGDTSGAGALAAAAAARVATPFLAGAFGPWIDDVRARLDDVAVSTGEVASAAALAAGDVDRALAAADAALARNPLRESAHRARWAALVAGGNRAEALLAYQRLRRTLAAELGVDPDPETEAAYVDLLGTAPPGRAAGPRPAGAAAAGAVAGPAAQTPFVGRLAELSELAAAWDQAVAGGRHVVVVTGEAGIGKSRLTSEVARRISRAGGLVLFGRCDQEAIVPYQPVVEALDGLVAAAAGSPPVGEEALAELAAVLPSLAGTRPRARGGRAGLFAAVTDLVEATADERPVLLVLDDLQWADDDTLLLVRHLLRRAGDARVLVVAISRDHDIEPGRALGDVVRSLDRDGWVRRLPLRGLAEAEVRELVARMGGGTGHGGVDPATARRLMDETAGNPFMLTELLRGGAPGSGPIPAGVQALVGARLAGLDAAATDLVRAAAVAGTRFDLDIAAAAAGLDGDAALDALDGALASGLVIEESADRYRFPHDIVRRTLVAQLSGARRRALHLRLAAAIERLRAGALDDHAAVLAHHSSGGAGPGGDRAAVRWARAASAQAAAHHAPAEAVRLCHQALAQVPPDDAGLAAEVTTDLGVAQLAAGDDTGIATLVDGAAQARRLGRADVLAAAALAMADLAAARPDRPELAGEAGLLVDAAVAAPVAGGPGGVDPLRHARLLVRQIRLAAAGAPPGPVPPGAALAALDSRIRELAGPGHLDERDRLAGELAVLAERAADAGFSARAAHEQAVAAATRGDRDAVAAALDRLAATGAAGAGLAVAAEAEHRVATLTLEGEFSAAVAALPAAVAARRACAGDRSAARLAGRHGALLRWLWPAAPAPGAWAGAGDATAALELLETGQRDRAAVALRTLVEDDRDRPEDCATLHDLGIAALVAADLAGPVPSAGNGGGRIGVAGAVAELRARLAPYADLVCGVGYRTFAGAAAFHLGRLAATTGEWSEAERHLLAALRLHTAWRARPWVALTQWSLATVLDARGRPTDREWITGLRAEAGWAVTRLGLRSG